MNSYIEQNKRKKLLLLGDDLRTKSGIGHMSKEIITQTCKHYNWVNLGGGMSTHPEINKEYVDLSEDFNKLCDVNDTYVRIIPTNNYGDINILRKVIKNEKPDGIGLFTDPRYWVWVFENEREIRSNIPIIYLNIWDNLPYPLYNRSYYDSCDALLAISKLTYNINQVMLGDKAKNKVIEYVPHGVDENIFKPVSKPEKDAFKLQLFKGKEKDFIVFFNSRNIWRKNIPDLIHAFKLFTDKLSPKDK